jgi:hypothetical protein
VPAPQPQTADADVILDKTVAGVLNDAAADVFLDVSVLPAGINA